MPPAKSSCPDWLIPTRTSGGGDGGDGTSAIHPDVRIVDAIDVYSDTFRKARTGGVTTVNVMPGSGHLLSGQTVYLKLREASTIYDMLFRHRYHQRDDRRHQDGQRNQLPAQRSLPGNPLAQCGH